METEKTLHGPSKFTGKMCKNFNHIKVQLHSHRRKMQFISVPMAISLELFFTSRTKQHFGHAKNNPDINRLVMRTKIYLGKFDVQN